MEAEVTLVMSTWEGWSVTACHSVTEGTAPLPASPGTLTARLEDRFMTLQRILQHGTWTGHILGTLLTEALSLSSAVTARTQKEHIPTNFK